MRHETPRDSLVDGIFVGFKLRLGSNDRRITKDLYLSRLGTEETAIEVVGWFLSRQRSILILSNDGKERRFRNHLF